MSIYEFVFDRLRSIRQDMIIARYNNEKSNKIYQIILCFYLLSDYKLCDSKNYDEFMNFQHVKEVLNLILSSQFCTKKSWFYSVYLLMNLKNFKSANNVLKIWKDQR